MTDQHAVPGPRSHKRRVFLATGLLAGSLASIAGAQTNLYWGDLHVHTNFSLDAYGVANTYVTPDEAYRFARGEEVTSTTGVRAKLSRPLDWLAISDHAEMYGLMPQLLKGDPTVLSSPTNMENDGMRN